MGRKQGDKETRQEVMVRVKCEGQDKDAGGGPCGRAARRLVEVGLGRKRPTAGRFQVWVTGE